MAVSLAFIANRSTEVVFETRICETSLAISVHLANTIQVSDNTLLFHEGLI
jgi:hypothetical protein